MSNASSVFEIAILTAVWQARAVEEDARIRQYQEAQAARESRDKSARRQQQKATEAAIKEARRLHMKYYVAFRKSGALHAPVRQAMHFAARLQGTPERRKSIMVI